MTSSRPNSVIARAISALISASSETSVFWNTARPAFSLQSRTADSPPSTFRSAITTAAPSPANLIAVARPIPLAAPVITATLPLSLSISDFLCFETLGCDANDSYRSKYQTATFRGLVRLAVKERAAIAGEGDEHAE